MSSKTSYFMLSLQINHFNPFFIRYFPQYFFSLYTPSFVLFFIQQHKCIWIYGLHFKKSKWNVQQKPSPQNE